MIENHQVLQQYFKSELQFLFLSFEKKPNTFLLYLLKYNFGFFWNQLAKIIFEQLDKKSVRRHVFFGKQNRRSRDEPLFASLKEFSQSSASGRIWAEMAAWKCLGQGRFGHRLLLSQPSLASFCALTSPPVIYGIIISWPGPEST